MTQTRIEQLIDELSDFISQCKPSPLSQSKLIVPKDQLTDIVEELKRRTPEELRRYQKIIVNRESIITQAEEQARQIIENARLEAAKLLDETTIMQQALARANGILDNARDQSARILTESTEKAEIIRYGVLSYSNDILVNIEDLLKGTFDTLKTKTEEMISVIGESMNTIASDRKQIVEQLEDPRAVIGAEQEEQADGSFEYEHNDDLDVDPADLVDD